MQPAKQIGLGTLLALCLLQPFTGAVANTIYNVSVDTSSLIGTLGFMDLQFNPGDITSPAANAVLTNLQGDLIFSGTTVVDGSVSGALPPIITFTNDTAFNVILQPATFGNSFGFTIDFSGLFESTYTGSGTRFSLGLLDINYDPLATIDPVGTLLQFELNPGGNVVATTFDADMFGTASIVTLTPVPLPAALVMFIPALGMLAAIGQRRNV